MKRIEVNGQKYEVIRNDQDCFDLERFMEKVTDYFDPYDYILGDFAYDKLRLKGYYESSNKNVKDINDIRYVDDYINNYCCYGSKIFLLKKIK